MARNREVRKAVAAETMRALAAGSFRGHDFAGAMAEAVAASHFCPAPPEAAEDPLPDSFAADGFAPAADVTRETTLEACRREWLAGSRRIGALNFASARNPGGGFLGGSQAQEESLARSSCLYPCLAKFEDEMYRPNRDRPSGVYTHDMIVSPGVPVFRTDGGEAVAPYLVTFVSAPAPNFGVVLRTAESEGHARASVREVLARRIRLVLAAFQRQNVDTVVLGAYGCGVFKNDVQTVAAVSKAELARFRFRKVVFPVPDPSMYTVFSAVLSSAAEGGSPTMHSDDTPMRPPSAPSRNVKHKKRVQ
ncbi:hypothetical protein DIPPA_34419 [Diplonema papillatum]|nr:hypothetical protein DIPPA_34419 [Diplonema papillatum]